MFKEPGTERRFLVCESQAGTTATSLGHLVSRHKAATMTIFVGPTKATKQLQCVVLRRARHVGQQVFWDLSNFYRMLGMSGYAAQPSKWVFARSSAWVRRFESNFGQSQLIYSMHYHEKMDRKMMLDFSRRCLPFTGSSTLGVLTLLSRWAFAQKFVGGLNDPTGKQQDAAKAVLEAMLRPVLEVAGEWERPVLVVKEWVCTWPRPLTFDDQERQAVLRVRSAELIIEPIFELAENDIGIVGAAGWCKELDHRFGRGASVPMLAFLEVCSASRLLEPLFLQVLWRLSRALEKHMGQLGQGRADSKGGELDYESVVSVMGSKRLDLKLAQYVITSRMAMKKNTMFSMCTDKGSVCRLQLRNAYITIPSGKAAICTPVVPPAMHTCEGPLVSELVLAMIWRPPRSVKPDQEKWWIWIRVRVLDLFPYPYPPPRGLGLPPLHLGRVASLGNADFLDRRWQALVLSCWQELRGVPPASQPASQPARQPAGQRSMFPANRVAQSCSCAARLGADRLHPNDLRAPLEIQFLWQDSGIKSEQRM